MCSIYARIYLTFLLHICCMPCLNCFSLHCAPHLLYLFLGSLGIMCYLYVWPHSFCIFLGRHILFTCVAALVSHFTTPAIAHHWNPHSYQPMPWITGIHQMSPELQSACGAMLRMNAHAAQVPSLLRPSVQASSLQAALGLGTLSMPI